MTGDLTARQWDLTWGEMYDDARADGCSHDRAVTVADHEMQAQLGQRPANEETT